MRVALAPVDVPLPATVLQLYVLHQPAAAVDRELRQTETPTGGIRPGCPGRDFDGMPLPMAAHVGGAWGEAIGAVSVESPTAVVWHPALRCAPQPDFPGLMVDAPKRTVSVRTASRKLLRQ